MAKKTSAFVSETQQKRKFWQAHVKAWKDSSLSQAEQCRRQSPPELLAQQAIGRISSVGSAISLS